VCELLAGSGRCGRCCTRSRKVGEFGCCLCVLVLDILRNRAYHILSALALQSFPEAGEHTVGHALGYWMVLDGVGGCGGI
jgi:hypothetical protein